ncbi:hypothetical protein TI39_contig378g00013 [Zymoseptoria brevis]|uniref:Major facilitator superfamily (MFS) profile domain-containing protein n=1 Tax=Zymoseptoria brevis TaxID=1047168 RepID=A0A0F4GNP2_9PEZI|nr:hypothetical protein TI39_contig378g00013 [Zymoseptoria brevis]
MEEKEVFAGKTFFNRAWELFSIPRLRRATIASAWIVISQQFSGINIMAFYSSTIFSAAGYSKDASLWGSWGFGLPWTPSVDATFFSSHSFPNMAMCLLGAGLCFLLPVGDSARVPLIAFFLYLFSALYGPGIGPIPSIYFSEAFPLSHREIGAAFTICVNNAMGSALGLAMQIGHRARHTRLSDTVPHWWNSGSKSSSVSDATDRLLHKSLTSLAIPLVAYTFPRTSQTPE